MLGVAITIAATSKGAATDNVDVLRADIAGEINTALGVGLVTFPLPVDFAADLIRLNAMGVAGQVLIAAFPTANGVGSNPLGMIYWNAYQARLAEFRTGIGLPPSVTRGSSRSPENYFTANGGIQNPDGQGTDAWGDVVVVEPYFSMGTLL